MVASGWWLVGATRPSCSRRAPPRTLPDNPHPSLPADLRTRALRHEDARAVHQVLAAQEQVILGRVEIDPADIVADWQRPSFDLATGTIGVLLEDRLIGYAEVTENERGDAAVLPEHWGRGIGTFLAHWMQETARAQGQRIIGMPTPQGSPGDRLLTALGYHVRWTSWMLQLPPGTLVPERPLPRGYRARAATPDEFAEAHEVIEDAFADWTTRDRESFADFRAQTVQRPGFEPWMLRVITGPDARIAAAALLEMADDGEAFVSRLGTRADQRRQGLGQALLVDAFARGREHGATAYGLSTDSRTGALDLYLSLGMRVTDTWVHRGIHLA